MTNTLETGGSEHQFVRVTHLLPGGEFELHLGCLKRIGPLLADVPNIAEFDVGGSFFKLKAQTARLELARHLRRNKILIAHAFDFYSNLMLIPTARLACVPVVIGSQRQIGDLLTPRQSAAQSMAFRLCDKVVCNSHAAARGLLKRGINEQKITVIPNAISHETFANAVPALPRCPDVIRIGMIARMNHKVKNHEGLLRVAAKLATRYPCVEYVLAGDGPLRGSLEALTEELGIRSSVKFLGDCRDIPSVLASVDISVLPSLSESLSNTILESMMAGKPVIAYRVGGNPELIQQAVTGFLVPLNDEEELANALGTLLANTSIREALGRKAQAFAQQNFSIESLRTQYEELYSSLLAEKGLWTRSKSAVVKATSRAVRVAIVAPTLRHIGGQSVQAKTLLYHWKNDGDVWASFIPIDPPFPRLLAFVEGIPCLRTVVRIPFYLRALWRGMKGIEVVHICSASYWSFLVATVPAWILASLRGKKVLINYHSGEARDHLQRWRTSRAILQRTDLLVVPSDYLESIFKDFGLKVEVVPNCVDFGQFHFRPRQPLHPRLVCTRGFGPYYSVDLVVRSFARVKREFPAARLWLVGNGEQEDNVRRYIQQEQLTGVEFTGSIPPDQVHRFYDQADIFVNASWLDNMPISILEAFASGTVVVSTAPEGIRYLVEHERTGLLCGTGDWQALAENVVKLLRNPDQALWLARNAFDESQRYRWEIVREEWLKVYRSLRSNGYSDDGISVGENSILTSKRRRATPESSPN